MDFPDDIRYIINIVTRNPYYLQHIPKIYRNNKWVVLAAVNANGYTIQYAPDKYRDDEYVAIIALNPIPGLDVCAFKCLSERLKTDKEFIKSAIKVNSRVLKYIPEEYKKDKEYVLTLILNNYHSLKHTHFKKDRKFILQVVEHKGNALEYAEDFQNDGEIILRAIRSDGSSLKHASDKFKSNRRYYHLSLLSLINHKDKLLNLLLTFNDHD